MEFKIPIPEKPRQSFTTVFSILFILLALNVFFVSIGLLGSFKSIGQGYGQRLIVDLASNPLIGLFIGLLITSIAQSSSATTSLVVALIAGGTFGDDPDIAIRMSIPIIMGANIGTTITNTIVSLGNVAHKREFRNAFSAAIVHDLFNILTVIIIFPFQYFTNFLGHSSTYIARLFENVGGIEFASPLKLIVNPQAEAIKGIFARWPFLIDFILNLAYWAAVLLVIIAIVKRLVEKKPIGLRTVLFAVLLAAVSTLFTLRTSWFFSAPTAHFILGLALMFGALSIMVSVMRSMVIDKFVVLLDSYVFRTDAHAMIAAAVITSIVQSSSVTTSVVVPLAGAGLLTLGQIYPYTLGANMGTTVTAILAALSTKNVPAIAAAFSHTIFNIIGISLWYPLRRVPIFLAEKLGGFVSRSAAFAILFIAVVFFLFPLLLIFISR